MHIQDFKNIFFIGIAGTGMSAIAQYLAGTSVKVSGSDRYFRPDVINDTRIKLELAGIQCYLQDGSGITGATDLVVASTAVEDTVPEIIKARSLQIPIMKRSEVLALIAESKKTIAIGGTSGKSTTSAMLFDILTTAGLSPSIISGAGLISIIKTGRIGNAMNGKGEWLIIEADESDGSIIQYKPEIGIVLNIDKDHQEINELISIFSTFSHNTKENFIVNHANIISRHLSRGSMYDFSGNPEDNCSYVPEDFQQNGMSIQFSVQHVPFFIKTVGRHNMENALAAIAAAAAVGVSLETSAEALKNYEGIYRRHQVIGQHSNIVLIDDYAHNPVKCAASIKACQPISPKVIAWFQPHGYTPTRFLKDDFIKEISEALRDEDEIWMSEIFYAGGTTQKNISANDLIQGIKANGKKAFFVEDRKDFFNTVKVHLTGHIVLLLMGARDPGLEGFASEVWNNLQQLPVP
ncbi:MAG: Mur ligase domain-containing protein [Ferruginibacter sp.]